MTIIEFSQSDYKTLYFTIYNKDGTVKDLTGLGVTFKVWDNDGNLVQSIAGTVDDAANGECHFDIPDGAFDTLPKPVTSGVLKYQDYKCEIEMTSGTVRDSTETMIFRLYESK
jgi:hypothetical protein